MADRARAPELTDDVHYGFVVLVPFPAQGLRWSPGSFQAVPNASSSPPSQVSDVYTSQSECDTAVDLVCSLCSPGGATKTQRIFLYAVQEQERRDTVHGRSRPARTMQREHFGLEQLVSILPYK